MEISQKIKIKVAETQFFSKIKMSGRLSLFEETQRKIAKLYNLAKKRNVYAYLYIFQIYHDMEQLINDIISLTENVKKLIREKQEKIQEITVKNLEKVTLAFSNPLHYGLIRIIELYNDLIVWLSLAQDSGSFLSSTGYFDSKGEIREKILKLLFKINRLVVKQLPAITFNHYLENDLLYQEEKVKYGEIDPNTLYIAITSSVTPRLTDEEINHISFKLKNISSKSSDKMDVT